jgi:hypothetical protein
LQLDCQSVDDESEALMTARSLAISLLAATAAISTSLPAEETVLSGRVTDSAGPLKGVVVTLESLDEKRQLSTTTGPDGLFHFDVPLDGHWSLIAQEPDHLFAIYGPLTISSGRTVRQDIQLERPRVLGADPVTCDRTLVHGRVEGLRKISPAAVQFCMRGARGNSCTHLGAGATIALYVLPGKYQLSLEGPDQQKLVWHSIDAGYCGEYEGIVNVLE